MSGEIKCDKQNGDSIHDKIASLCGEITSVALSCHTLKSDQADKCMNRPLKRRIEEFETGMWLDGQLIEYQTLLLRDKKHKQNKRLLHKDNTKEGKRRIKALKTELFDMTVSDQQQRRLIERMKISAAMMFSCFTKSMINETNLKKQINEIEQEGFGYDCVDEDDHFLRREALRDRHDCESRIASKINRLDSLKEKASMLEKQCQRMMDTQESLSIGSKKVINSGDSRSSDLKCIEAENSIFRQILLDTIMQPQVDWYSNEKIRKLLHELHTRSSKG